VYTGIAAIEQLDDEVVAHQNAITTDGLEDLFDWASQMVADRNVVRAGRSNDQKIRRNVLQMIQHSKEVEAGIKYTEEIRYLQQRVIALLQILTEKVEEIGSLKQILLTQYFVFARVGQLEEEVKQLKAMTWYREEAEAERRHLMDALAKLKKERDYLDELVTTVESENMRLAKIVNDTGKELERLKNRKWWHGIAGSFHSLIRCGAT